MGNNTIDNDFLLVKALSINITDELKPLLSEMAKLQEDNGVKGIDEFYNLLSSFYFENVFNRKT